MKRAPFSSARLPVWESMKAIIKPLIYCWSMMWCAFICGYFTSMGSARFLVLPFFHSLGVACLRWKPFLLPINCWLRTIERCPMDVCLITLDHGLCVCVCVWLDRRRSACSFRRVIDLPWRFRGVPGTSVLSAGCPRHQFAPAMCVVWWCGVVFRSMKLVLTLFNFEFPNVVLEMIKFWKSRQECSVKKGNKFPMKQECRDKKSTKEEDNRILEEK